MPYGGQERRAPSLIIIIIPHTQQPDAHTAPPSFFFHLPQDTINHKHPHAMPCLPHLMHGDTSTIPLVPYLVCACLLPLTETQTPTKHYHHPHANQTSIHTPYTFTSTDTHTPQNKQVAINQAHPPSRPFRATLLPEHFPFLLLSPSLWLPPTVACSRPPTSLEED